MATDPDRIDPQAPPETPAPAQPDEAPMTEPPEFDPPQPDIDDPGRLPQEIPGEPAQVPPSEV